MSSQIYSVTGRVVDRNSGDSIVNVRVQAWDVNRQFNEPYGASNVDENGRFILCLDIGRKERQVPPDLFFKVYRDAELLASTEDSVVLKGGEDKEVLIELNIAPKQPEGRDRFNAQQFFTGVDFLAKSDFKGVFNETKSKAGTRVGFVADMVMNTVTRLNVKPIRTANTKEHDVINQPVEGVRQKLESEKIVVNEVLPYDPKLNKSSLMNLGAAPPRLKEGQKINLYEENGSVRYYSIVKEANANSDFAAIANDHKEQLAKMQDELKSTRQNAARKDEEINAITKEHKEQFQRIQEELNVTKANAAKKDSEINQVTTEHKNQLLKVQEELKVTREKSVKTEAEISQITAQHREQLAKVQEELKATREISIKKEAEMSQITAQQKEQLAKVQEELKATREFTIKKETDFNTLQQELKTMRQEQANIANFMKPENLTKFIKETQRINPIDPNIGRNIPPLK